MNPSAILSSSEKILVRGVNWLGDAVMSTPALQRLREAKPGTRITLLTPHKLLELWQDHPSVDSVMTFTEEETFFQIGRRLRSENFNVALVLPNSPRSALETFWAGIPERIGYAQPWRNFFLTRPIAPSPDAVPMRKSSLRKIKRLVHSSPAPSESGIPISAHHLYHYLRLVTALGARPDPLPPHIEVTAAEVTAIRQRFELPVGTGRRLLLFGLNAGAEYGPAKRWPRERFVAAAKMLQQQTQCHWWIFGSQADRELASSIAAEIRTAKLGPPEAVRCLAGETSLRQLCAALKACDVLLTNDTGPMHLAAAVGTPVVAPFGSSSPELTSPGLPNDGRHFLLKATVPCAPCFRRECPIDFRCMKSISVEAIAAAVLKAAGQEG